MKTKALLEEENDALRGILKSVIDKINYLDDFDHSKHEILIYLTGLTHYVEWEMKKWS